MQKSNQQQKSHYSIAKKHILQPIYQIQVNGIMPGRN